MAALSLCNIRQYLSMLFLPWDEKGRESRLLRKRGALHFPPVSETTGVSGLKFKDTWDLASLQKSSRKQPVMWRGKGILLHHSRGFLDAYRALERLGKVLWVYLQLGLYIPGTLLPSICAHCASLIPTVTCTFWSSHVWDDVLFLLGEGGNGVRKEAWGWGWADISSSMMAPGDVQLNAAARPCSYAAGSWGWAPVTSLSPSRWL